MHQNNNNNNNNNNNENATSFDDYIKKQKIIIAACAVAFALNVAALATDYARIPGDSEVGLFQSCYTLSSTGGKVCYSEVRFSDSEGCGVGLQMTHFGRLGGIMAVLSVSFVCGICLIRIFNPTFAENELREKKRFENAQNGIATDGTNDNNNDDNGNDKNEIGGPKIVFLFYNTTTRVALGIFEFLAFISCIVLFTAPLCEGHPTLVAAEYSPGPAFILFGLLFFFTIGFFHCWEKNQPDPAVTPTNNNNNNNDTNGHNGNTNHHTNNDNNHNEMQQQQQQHPHHYQQQQQPPHQEYNPQYYFGAPTNNNNNNNTNNNNNNATTSYPPPPPTQPPSGGPAYPSDSAAIRFAGFNESRGQE